MNPTTICSISLLQLKVTSSHLSRHVHQVCFSSKLVQQIIVDFPPAIDGSDMKRSLACSRSQVWIHLVLGQQAFKKSSVIVLHCPVNQAETRVVADSLCQFWFYLQLTLRALIIPGNSQKPSHLCLAPFSLSSSEAAHSPMWLKWFPFLWPLDPCAHHTPSLSKKDCCCSGSGMNQDSPDSSQGFPGFFVTSACYWRLWGR